MMCPRCAEETHTVVRTYRMRNVAGKFANNSDVRIQQCCSCSLIFHVECLLKGVEVFDPIKMRVQVITPTEYEQKYLPKEMQSAGEWRRQQKLFD